MPAGRPSDYSAELAETICQRISNGETLRAVCRDDAMPDKTTVLRWLAKHEEFRTQYRDAREDLVEHWADEIVEISDDTANDTHTTTYEGGVERTSPNTEWISRARLRVDSRKWLMSKLAPKKYGDHLKIDQDTKHSVDDSVGALFERIVSQGKRIHDK
jgi:hypothetical protein